MIIFFSKALVFLLFVPVFLDIEAQNEDIQFSHFQKKLAEKEAELAQKEEEISRLKETIQEKSDIKFTSFYGTPKKETFSSRGGKFYFFVSCSLGGSRSKSIDVYIDDKKIGTFKGYTSDDYGVLPLIVIGPIALWKGKHSIELRGNFQEKDIAQMSCLEIINDEDVLVHQAIPYNAMHSSGKDREGSFTNEQSEELLFIGSTSGYSNNGEANVKFQVKLDNENIFHLETPAKQAKHHRALAPRAFFHQASLDKHSLKLTKQPNTRCNQNDCSQLVVLEYSKDKITPYSKVIPYSRGSLPREGKFQAKGGTLVFFISATASHQAGNVMQIAILLNGEEIGQLKTLNKSGKSRVLVPTFIVKEVPKGDYRVKLECLSGTRSGENDVSQVVVLELK